MENAIQIVGSETENRCWYKKPRVRASLIAPSLWGTLHKQGYSHIPPTSEPASTLASITSLLEGVGNYCAACAATRFVHYTPPPFVALIVHCFFSAVKSFLKIHLNQAGGRCRWIGFRRDVRVNQGCENYVNRFSSRCVIKITFDTYITQPHVLYLLILHTEERFYDHRIILLTWTMLKLCPGYRDY